MDKGLNLGPGTVTEISISRLTPAYSHIPSVLVTSPFSDIDHDGQNPTRDLDTHILICLP